MKTTTKVAIALLLFFCFGKTLIGQETSTAEVEPKETLGTQYAKQAKEFYLKGEEEEAKEAYRKSSDFYLKN